MKLICLAAVLLVAAPLTAGETVVSFDVEGVPVTGTLETPPGEPAPVVLMLHGFTGSRDELPVKGTDEGVFSRTARLLADAGYASLRIDFRGSGESGGDWADTTFSSQIKDAIAAIDWLAEHEAVMGGRLAVLGWSQGGLVAIHAAAERPDQTGAAILWAPAVNPLHSYEALLGVETMTKAMESGPDDLITAKLPWGAETTLKARFFHEMALTSPPVAASQYGGPLKVIVGLRDAVVTPQPASGEILLKYHEGFEDLSIIHTNHVWDAFTGPHTIDEQMVPVTLDWLNDHL